MVAPVGDFPSRMLSSAISGGSATGVPAQIPPPHTSLHVVGSASSHGAVLFAYTHPPAELQPSSVHPFPSLHTSGEPPTQVPPEQVSAVVQAFPSLHGA